MSTAIRFDNISKQYRLGLVSTRTLSHDLNRWWQVNMRGKEDPYLKIGEANDRTTKGTSDYVWALKDINLEVEQGDVLGIIGKNGAGKSTLLKILSKVTAPTTGTIQAKGRIASLLEVGTGFHPEMTGRENIFMNGAIMGMSKAEIRRKLDEIVDFAGVERYLDTPVKRYSSGMTVRLGFAIAAHLEPEILVVDEVLAVGDAEFQKKAVNKMQDVSKSLGRTVLFVSHNLGAVRNLCKSCIVMKEGSVSVIGNVGESIDCYLNDIYLTMADSTKNSDLASFRINGLAKEVEIIEAHITSKKAYYSTLEDIKIVYVVKGNRTVNGFRINLAIKTLEEQPIGVLFGNDLFNIKEGELKRICLEVKNHFLALGKYKISSSIGKGNYKEGITDFDILMDHLSFSVETADQYNEAGYSVWNKQWGSIIFNGKATEFNPE